MYKEILLDCTMLESPEPLNLVIKNLENVDEKSYIKMIHRMEPMILYGILNENGFKYIPHHEENQVKIYIYKDDSLGEYLRCIQD